MKFATREVLWDFLDDGVVYLEIRTTPRDVGGAGKEGYVRGVLEAVDGFLEESGGRMAVGVLLSVDRRNSVEEGVRVVELGVKYREGLEGGSCVSFAGIVLALRASVCVCA